MIGLNAGQGLLGKLTFRKGENGVKINVYHKQPASSVDC